MVKQTADGKKYLLITARSKKKVSQVPSLAAAVTIYERIKGEPREHVFFKHLKGRPHAMKIMQEQFKKVLEMADPKASEDGQERTLYSASNPGKL